MNTEKQNYKIKVGNEAESKEVQGLFLGLGYDWLDGTGDIYTADDIEIIYSKSSGVIFYRSSDDALDDLTKENYQSISIPQLRDLSVIHRNDVNDATHKHKNIESEKYYKACDEKFYHFSETGHWNYVGDTANDVVSKHVVPIDQEQPKMTWQDALRAVAEGKEVEMIGLINEWADIKEFNVCRIMGASEFRLKPQTIHIEGGNYTKEELLKIAGEME